MEKNERNYHLLSIYYLLLTIDQSCEVDINTFLVDINIF